MNYSTLQIFSCPAYSLVNSQKRNKLESKSKKCNFIGFTEGVKGFKLWVPKTRSAFTTRDVIFDEESMLQERSETKDKSQGGAPDSSADTQVKGIEFSDCSKSLMGQMRNLQIQMEMSRRLLRSNIDH